MAAAYAPDIGHGFLKDDFFWIAGSRFQGPLGWLALFSRSIGFYRPLVSLTFGLDEQLFGLAPMGYAATNLLIAWACMLEVAWLARALGMGWGCGVLAAGLWGLNPHGVGWGLLWISGRPALLITALCLLTAVAFVKGRTGWAAAACLLALLAKEEAVLLPLILAAWALLLSPPGERPSMTAVARRVWPLVVSLAVYALLRARTLAHLPWNAPSYYRPTFAPLALLRNVLEYTDRACTLSVAAVLLAALVCGRWPRPDALERRWALAGLVWLVGGYALTVFIPVRSSLYAPLPAAGTVLAATALVHALWREAPLGRRRLLVVGALVAAVLMVPLLRSRNVRLVREARLSAQALAAIAEVRDEIAAGRVLVLHDTPEVRPSLADCFGTLLEAALRLTLNLPHPRAWIEPPPPNWRDAGLVQPLQEPAVHLWLREGRVIRERGP
jgi:hypothetical protein